MILLYIVLYIYNIYAKSKQDHRHFDRLGAPERKSVCSSHLSKQPMSGHFKTGFAYIAEKQKNRQVWTCAVWTRGLVVPSPPTHPPLVGNMHHTSLAVPGLFDVSKTRS
jgi:hypothetical protein